MSILSSSVTNNIFKVIYPNVSSVRTLQEKMSTYVLLTKKTWELGLFTRLTLQIQEDICSVVVVVLAIIITDLYKTLKR